MDKLKAIIKREYFTRVRSRGFIIGTILSPILMSSFVFVPWLIARVSQGGTQHIVVLDRSGDPALYSRFDQLLMPTDSTRSRRNRYIIEHEEVGSDEALQVAQDSLRQRIATRELDGYIVLPADLLRQEKLSWYARNVGDFESREQISNALNRALIERRVNLAGLEQRQIQDLTREVQIEVLNARGEKERGQTFILSFGLVMIIYITILVYGVMVMRGVIEEKQSRIVEVLLSSVRPFELMLGKLLGIGMVGLTQYLIWTVFGVLISSITALPALPALIANWQSLPKIQPILLVFFPIYFVLGYFLYATLYAMVGAMVSSEEDGQQLQLPVTMTIVFPMMVSTMVMRDPGSTASVVLSIIPFFSPMLMFLRLGLQTPPWWQIALSIGLMIGTILGAIWVSAKIYRVGILMYGKKPTIPEILRWLRYS